MAGLGRINRPGLDFECGFDWEHARGTANASRVAVRASTGRAELEAAHGGAAAMASRTGRSRARERERTALRASLPGREALGRLEVDGNHTVRRRGSELQAPTMTVAARARVRVSEHQWLRYEALGGRGAPLI